MTGRLWARVGVKAAVLRDHRLLLLRRRDDLDLFPGLWDLPGGGVEKSDRTLEGALAREVLEETNFRVRVGPVLDVSFDKVRVRSEPRFPSVVVCFRCSVSSRRDPRLDPREHAEFAWVTRQAVHELDVIPRLKPAMDAAFRATAP